MIALAVRGLRKAYGGVVAVDGVSFDLEEGRLLALIGPNGAGKSTCFNMLNGQIRPDSGSVQLFGRELVGRPPRRIARLGIGRTFQITATFGSMTVQENLQMALISRHRRDWALWRPAGAMYAAEARELLRILVSSATDYWRMVLGVVIIALVVASPQGVGGRIAEAFERRRAAKAPAP